VEEDEEVEAAEEADVAGAAKKDQKGKGKVNGGESEITREVDA
jgi:hypothetical protein